MHQAVSLVIILTLSICLASPHRGSFYPPGYGGHHHYDDHHHHRHHGGCRHSHTHSHEDQPDKELTVREKYPFIKPTLYQFESGRYAPKQMQEMQEEINKSVQVGIQVWNRNSGRTEDLTEKDDVEELPIDIRFTNDTKKEP